MSDCKLLNGIFSYLIQILLGLVAVGSLVLKRHIERPQRPWKIWCFDVGKQLFGGFFVHIGNILVSSYILNKSGGDQCAWYFINFFVDCTFGVGIVYISHFLLCYSVKYFYPNTVLNNIGEYNNPPQLKIWIIQLLPYIFSLIINKIIIVSILYQLENPINKFSNWLFKSLKNKPNEELIIVMILCPWILSTIQLWLFDWLLKAKNKDDNNYIKITNKRFVNSLPTIIEECDQDLSSNNSNDENDLLKIVL